jgi:thiosulfate/3-mercaptopyruvate sulfurtransferase
MSTPRYTTLISVEQLQGPAGRRRAADGVRLQLRPDEPAAGEEQYLAGARRRRGVRRLDDACERDTAARQGRCGGGAARRRRLGRPPSAAQPREVRHVAVFVGFANDMQAVVYDRNGANYCGRLWWMLKWAGHEAVAVLDGGLQAWQAAGGECARGEEPAHFQSNFVLGRAAAPLATTQDAAPAGRCAPDAGRRPRRRALRARSSRWTRGRPHPRGAQPPLRQNLGPDGKFKPAAQLRAEFEALLQGRDPAGGPPLRQRRERGAERDRDANSRACARPALYAGSWSEWSNTPGLPTRQGAEP